MFVISWSSKWASKKDRQAEVSLAKGPKRMASLINVLRSSSAWLRGIKRQTTSSWRAREMRRSMSIFCWPPKRASKSSKKLGQSVGYCCLNSKTMITANLFFRYNWLESRESLSKDHTTPIVCWISRAGSSFRRLSSMTWYAKNLASSDDDLVI